ncbi:hypothetical protein [Nostoc sp. FACHB-190]|uniref:hypothetical protein n=1 Tax=Nostoc sp. FACHB-190 TaxID=2692838 RepID=UPI0016876C7B|nr:hypothetical protein [Nostoc sp. FACHB-190]MBD2299530.1 hypothetical protein [Nostoc sp. FACHB-190]
MSSVFDFNDELKTSAQELTDAHLKIKKIHHIYDKESDELMHLKDEIIQIAESTGINLKGIIETTAEELTTTSRFQWDDDFFLSYNPLLVDARVKEEIYRNPEILPPLSNLDYAIVGIAGLVATLLDFLVVKIPNDINYLGRYQQDGSSFTKWLKTLGINQEGRLNQFLQWCEDNCKVSYDQSINPNIRGFNPRSHRLLSLGHDPLFGLIFGTLDILNGSMTAFDINGKLHIVKTFDLPLQDKVFAPLIWLGHIISDMCTKMGVPIPGWAFLQIMQFGSYSSNTKNIADISRWMYLNGYDLRHFLTMSSPVAVIEIIIRGYYYLSSLYRPEQIQHHLHSSIANKEIYQIKSNLKLNKMLFLAHAISSSGNALKLFTYSGNPLAINLPQWIFLVKESVSILQVANRDTTVEKIIRNRDSINACWNEIKNINI